MAVLEKIRTKLGILITVLIALALLSFIIDPTTLEVTMRTFSSKYDVGKINGNSIKYEEFQSKVDYYTHIYNLTSGSQSVPEAAMDQIYNSAWQDLESELLILPLMKKAGIRVGEEELFDLCQGEHLSPVIEQEPAFRDASGNFSREQLLQFIQAIPTDQSGNLAAYWNYLETNMERQQYFAKYMSLLSQSNILNPVELRRNIEDNNVTANAEFVVVPFGFQPDSTLKVSRSEIEKYYRDHKENYRQTASRDIEYVVFEVTPSDDDVQFARKAIDKVYDGFCKAENLKTFLAHNSDTPLQNYFYKAGELESSYPELEAFAFGKDRKETVLAPFRKDEMFVAARVNSRQMMSDSVYVKHILLPAGETAKADSLLKEVQKKGADFSAIAQANSVDRNPNAAEPGDLGWMTQQMMIPGMERVLTARAGESFVLNTAYGVHVVKVTECTKPVEKVQLALLTKEIIAGKETFQRYYAQANDLVVKSEGKLEKFNQAVAEGNLPVVPAMGVREGAKQISRYQNTREVSRWIYEAKLGDVSPIITVDNDYFFVVALTGIHEEGYAPVDEVASSIEYTLLQQKRGEKLAKEVAEKIKGLDNMEAIAEALNTTVNKQESVAFGALGSQSVDPALVGAIAGAKEQTITGPVIGRIGVYVLKVNGREAGSFYTEDDAKMRRQQLAAYQTNMLPGIFNEIGEVVDHRARFF